MLEYILVLLFISIILMIVLYRFKNRIPLRPNIIYCSVVISFVLGAFFPMAISTLTPGGVVAIYFALIILSAIALCWVEKRTSLNDSQTVEQFAGHGTKTAPLYRSEAAFETCATEDCTPGVEPNNDSHTFGSAGEPEARPEIEPEIKSEVQPEPEPGENKPTAGEFELEDIPANETRSVEDPAADTMDIVEDTAKDIAESTVESVTEDSVEGSVEDIVEDINEKLPKDISDVEYDDTEPEGLAPSEEQPPARHVEETEEIKEISREDGDADTVNSYVSAGFKAKAKGDPARAIELFYKALQTEDNVYFTVAMALEISGVYQDLGQYQQAGMIINSVLEQAEITKEPALTQDLQSRLIFLKVLAELLQVAKMPGAPYSKIPNLIKIKANVETAKRLKEFTKGVDESEK